MDSKLAARLTERLARLTEAVARARRDDLQLAVLFIDLDRFKNINDSLGHAVGDGLLIQVAQRLSGAVRAGDTVSRLGGDEFVILLEGLTQAGQAAQVAQALLQACSGHYSVGEHELAATPSIGIAFCPTDGEDVETLLKNADTAMYHAKAAGRNNFQFFAAAMNTSRLARACACPTNSANPVGRRDTSSGSSRPAAAEVSVVT